MKANQRALEVNSVWFLIGGRQSNQNQFSTNWDHIGHFLILLQMFLQNKVSLKMVLKAIASQAVSHFFLYFLYSFFTTHRLTLTRQTQATH